MYIIYTLYIHMHVFRPSQDLSVWLVLTSREHTAHIYVYINFVCHVQMYRYVQIYDIYVYIINIYT